MEIFKDEKSLIRVIGQELAKVIPQKGRVVLGLSGGRSVEAVFNELKELSIDWTKVHVLLIDERWVSLDSPDSNSALIQNKLVSFLPGINFYPFEATLGQQKYNQILKSLGGQFDIVILGVGEDGHIASLFPSHQALKSKEDGYIIIEDSPKDPPKRLSASPKLLQKSQMAAVLFVGQGKQQAFQAFQEDSGIVANCPAKLLTSVKNLVILAKF